MEFYQNNPDCYEEAVEAICKNYPIKGVYIDCGAHVGRHTSAMLANTNCVILHAIEAIPELCNIISNKITDPRLQLHNVAVSNNRGSLLFSIAENAMGYSGLIQRKGIPVTNWRQIEVESFLLDQLVENNSINNMSLIKMDLEGAEFSALQGSKDILKNFSPLVIFENSLKEASVQYGYDEVSFFNFFNKINYCIFDFFGNQVDSEYWSYPLQTYMFLAIKKDNEFSEKIKFIAEIIEAIRVDHV